MPHAILLIEDDPNIGASLVTQLELEDFKVDWAQDLASARKQVELEKYSLLLLDLNLPDGNGLFFCKELRRRDPQLPMIVLTASVDEDSVVSCLEAGATDYIKKPFGSRELLARIRAALRRVSSDEVAIALGGLSLNPDQRTVLFQATKIELNRREFDILQHLLQRPGSVVSRDSLLQAINRGGEIFDRTIDSHVSHLRSKLKNVGVVGLVISSVYGVGYRLEPRGD